MAKITGKYEVLYIIDPTLGEEGAARRGNPFSFRFRRNRAMRGIAGDTDCHGLAPSQ